jgi:hypothetical protein
MSGINELKEKSKKQLEVNEKRKIDLSEMIGDQSVGKPVNQKDGKPEIKQTSQLDSQKPISPVTQTAIHPEVQSSGQPTPHQTIFPNHQLSGQTAIHPDGKMDVQLDVKPEATQTRQPTIFSTKQSKNQKIPTCKMTFNIREDIHKAFHDLYANRILQGRATEKSEMICEAIQLLITTEEAQIR